MSKQVNVETIMANERPLGRYMMPDEFMKSQGFAHQHIEDMVSALLLAGAPSPRVVGMNLTRTGGLGISVAAGLVIDPATGKTHEAEAATALVLAAANAALPRVDSVYAKLETDAEDEVKLLPFVQIRTDDEKARNAPRFTEGQFNTATELHTRAVVQVRAGTPNAAPVAPALQAGEVELFRVQVPANAVALVAGNVTDVRGTVPSLYQVANNVGGVLDELIEAKVASLLMGDMSPIVWDWDNIANRINHSIANASAGSAGLMSAAHWTKLEGVAAGAIAGVDVRKNGGAVVGTRPALNYIEGAGVTLAVADNPAQNRVDITVAQAAIATVSNITPAGGADFTLTQNGVNVLTSVNAGALVNTLYLNAGKVGFGVTDPQARIDVIAGANAAGLSASQIRLRSNRFHLGAAGSVNAIGGISFISNDSTNPTPETAEAARISCIAATVHSSIEWSAHVVIHTTNGMTISEVARFTSTNQLGLNVTNPSAYLHVAYPSGAAGASGVTSGLVRLATGTYTDSSTVGGGTAAAWAHVTIGTPTLGATNAGVTTTDAASLYITAAPIAGPNQTITNPWSLWVDAGNERHDGSLQVGGTTAPAEKIDVTGNIRVSGVYKVGANQIIGARKAGWTLPTSTKTRNIADYSALTNAQLGAILAALVNDVHADGGGTHMLLST